MYGQVEFDNIHFLLDEIKKTVNYYDYPSIFPYDQLLRNQDRHVDNHLIIQSDKKQIFYYSVDGDRIFAGYPLSNILEEKENFKCFTSPDYKILYSSVDEKIFEIILKYASIIETLSKEQLDLLIEYLESYYDIELSCRESIESFIKYRKSEMSLKCISNQDCFKNIKQKILIS